jgi:flavin-binding protein dodecin
VRNTNLSDGFLHSLAEMAADTLVHLDLFGCDNVSIECVKTIALFSKLESIDFTGIRTPLHPSTQQSSYLHLVTQNCPYLKTFIWRSNPHLRDDSILALCLNCKQLETLDLQKSANISEVGFFGMQKLKNLNVLQCPRITCDGFINLLHLKSGSFQLLELSANLWVNDALLEAIASTQQIRWFGVQACPGITNTGLIHLMKNKYFMHLNIKDNGQISMETINLLKSKFGNVVSSAITYK